MKYLFFLLSFCTPVISTATWGVELLGGTNMHVGPMNRYMMDKGSRPGWTGILKLGGYFRKIEFGIGVETGTWDMKAATPCTISTTTTIVIPMDTGWATTTTVRPLPMSISNW